MRAVGVCGLQQPHTSTRCLSQVAKEDVERGRAGALVGGWVSEWESP